METVSRRRLVIGLVGTLLATGVLGVVLWQHWDEVSDSIALVSIPALLVLIGLQVVAYVLRTQVFGMCVRDAGAHTPSGALHGASAATFLANTVVPMYVGGWVRVAMLKRLAGKAGPTVGQMVTADGISLFVEAVITVVLIVICSSQLDIAWWWPVGLAAICVGIGAGLWHARRRLADRPWVQALRIFESPWRLALVTAMLAAVLLVQPIRFLVVLDAVGLDVSFFEALLAFILTSAGAILPVGPGPASVGGAAAVLGHEGLAQAAAAGVVLAGAAALAAAGYTVVALGVLGWQRRRAGPAAPAAAG